MQAWAVRIIVVAVLAGGSAFAQVPDAYREGSHYDEIARDVARLGLRPEDSTQNACVNNVYAQNPCPGVVAGWYEFTKKHDLPRTAQTATMLQAYIRKDYRTADRIYAKTKGFVLPNEPEAPTGVAKEIRRLGVPRADALETVCSNDLLSAKPCPRAVRAWRIFAEEHGLTLNRQTADMFEAYVEGKTRLGDKLYAAAKNQKQEAPPRNKIAAEAQGLGARQRSGLEVGGCENNYYSVNPCLEAVRAWRQFAEKHGLPLDKRSADLFQAYIEGDQVTGDKLYAAAKGISITELLQQRGHDIVEEPRGNPLYVPIFPGGPGR